MIYQTSEEFLEANKVAEYGDIIFIKPHAQFICKNDEMTVKWGDSLDGQVDDSFIKKLELMGRVCYKSEDKITGESAERFINMLINSGHESVLEHLTLTVKFVGSRAMSHQLVRHRLNAFSQESQRYCNYGKSDKLYAIVPETEQELYARQSYYKYVQQAYENYLAMLQIGWKAEDARYLLPNCTKTEVVMSCNIRQWRHVFEDRALNPKAQWEIRMISLAVLTEFARVLPELFSDLIK